jgi:transmembrane sensor
MSLLRAPLGRHLRRPLDDLAQQRLWLRVRAPRAARRRTGLLLAAAAALAVIVALVVVGRDPGGPLRLDADRVVLEVAADGAPLEVAASDGSSMRLSPRTRVEVIENDDEAFATLVTAGRARFEVKPGGSRRWTVDCGAFVVEVVGTVFEVERDAGAARVSVERGEVVVRGEAVPGRIVRVRAGEDLTVPATIAAPSEAPVGAAEAEPSAPTEPPASSAEAPPDAPGPPTTPPGPIPDTSSSAAPGPSASAAAASSPRWRDLARAGDYDEAYDALGPAGLRSATQVASVDELLALADVARLSGHPADAVAPLSRILSDHGGDGRASLAALTLGRLQLDALGQPAAAAVSLNRAIASGLPAGLAEDALARRVEAYARAGDVTAGRAALAELERRFPASKRIAAARLLVFPAP